MTDDQRNPNRSERSSESRRRVDESAGARSLAAPHPVGDRAIEGRVGARLAKAQEKPEEYEQYSGIHSVAGDLFLYQALQDRDHGPTQTGNGQDAARTKTVSQPPARHQSDCITEQESAENPAQRLVGQTELGSQVWRRNRDIAPVHVEYESDRAEQSDNPPAEMTRLGTGKRRSVGGIH